MLVLIMLIVACSDDESKPSVIEEPDEIGEEPSQDSTGMDSIAVRPALLFTPDDYELLRSRYELIPEKVSSKSTDIVGAWFSDDASLKEQQTQEWIEYWKGYAERWTSEALEVSRPDGVAMRGVWRTLHLFDIVASWGYLTQEDVLEYRNALVRTIELAVGDDTTKFRQPPINEIEFLYTNIWTDVFLAAGIVGYSFPELPQSRHWIALAEEQALWQLDNLTWDGVWHECPRYHGYMIKLLSQYFTIAKNRAGVDYFQHENFKAMVRWFVEFSTPKTEVTENNVVIPGIGDTTWDTEWHESLNICAQHYLETDPELAMAANWIWEEAGSPYVREFVMGLLNDPTLSSVPQELGSIASLEKGHILMREAAGTEDEIWFMLKCGRPSLAGHENDDWNSFSLFAYGQPMSLDAGSGHYDDDHHRDWNKKAISHNTVAWREVGVTDPFEYEDQSQEERGEVLLWESNGEIDYSISDGAESARVDKYTRHVIFIKPDYFVIWDEIEEDKASSWLLHTLASELEWGDRDVSANTGGNTLLDLHVVLPDRDLVPNEREGQIGNWSDSEPDGHFFGIYYQKYFEVFGDPGEDYLMVLRPRKNSMSKIEVISNDGGKTLEINTGDRRDVITFNENQTIIQKGSETMTINY